MASVFKVIGREDVPAKAEKMKVNSKTLSDVATTLAVISAFTFVRNSGIEQLDDFRADIVLVLWNGRHLRRDFSIRMFDVVRVPSEFLARCMKLD